MKYYKYVLTEDKTFYIHELRDVLFENEFVCIRQGRFIAKKGYAWDGCSPKKKFKLFGKSFVIGIPDGSNDQCKWATLVHDIICQFRASIPISKVDSVNIFRRMLRIAKWPLWRVYTYAVDKFGPQDFML